VISDVGKELGIVPLVIQGEELAEKGFGGIYGVGRAAAHGPALAVLSHRPAGASSTVAWVGKGIVYDTGGLSIKVGQIAIASFCMKCEPNHTRS
jgi:probable aminopeptidase NPEPL1